MLKCSFTNMVELDTIKHPIILFDGICNYCNNAVNFSIKWNKNKNLRFATLQSELAKELLEYQKKIYREIKMTRITKNDGYKAIKYQLFYTNNDGSKVKFLPMDMF